MTMTHTDLPQLNGQLFVTDSGLETELIFHDGLDLPCFASFPLLDDDAGRERLRRYAQNFVDVARRHGVGAMLETATWRANPDWADQLGYDSEALARMNRRSIAELIAVRDENPDLVAAVVSGTVGPRGDGYAPATRMTAAEAEAYHSEQIGTFASTEADLVTAYTICYHDEAIGIANAAAANGLPVAISFTLETDGRLPSGETLGDAIQAVDAATDGAVAYYQINCAHPTHFASTLDDGAAWAARISGVRPNASTKSHAELDESTDLDEGDPADLAARCAALKSALPNVTILGGCCGTDIRHVAAIWSAWTT
jgi:homocysteine S-methyltransferase